MGLKFDEDSRVKVPALLHFLRLGYNYQSKKTANIDHRNNIFKNIFKESIKKINSKDYNDQQIEEIIKEISLLTDNEKDKGQHFFNRLISYNKVKLIDLKNTHNNDFRVVSELRFGDNQNNFRPDITILINGIPLGFIEVKKPNNKDGLKSEFDRMEKRQNKKFFTHFFNQFQVLAFSNNMPYNDNSQKKLFGSYYTTPNFDDTYYNNFREENKINVSSYLDDQVINNVLEDNNIFEIKFDNEFKTNLDTETYTNRFITSLFSKERLIFFIRYGITYVNSQRDGLDKHIIRYPQFFAIKNIVKKIDNGMNRGIIWHTQGSGKTALSYFATNVLRDYYQKQNIVTKFYFVVDRLDLLMQASDEFKYRGMELANIDSKEDFVENIKSSEIVLDSSGARNYKGTMNVVNIQKFSEDSTVPIDAKEDIQRIYFLDEVHRGYKPKGTFLANLLGADPDGIYIGLTGTPLLKEELKSIDIFEQYIHKYYYNKSIADGYTLKIKKENIATYFKKNVREALGMEKKKKIPSSHWNEVTKKDVFVEEFCDYIVNDFENFLDIQEDYSLGFMIVTSCSEQARKINKWFENNSDNFNSALVLYDEDNNKEKQNGFRGTKSEDGNEIKAKYDGVIVYSMLLTGFDAPRLKRLYLLREIKNHSLLQTLARVNRPYNDLKYGYIVDFVDITEEYEETNQRYLEELQKDINDEDDTTNVEDMFIDVEKVKKDIQHIENKLIIYMANIENNLEEFRKQLEPLNEDDLLEIRSDIDSYKEAYNELRM
ncbi:MAG: type I restriction endonuclease, partial [bacterium]